MRQARVSPGFTVVVAESISELQPFVQELQELASTAIEPNVFYEPWMLLPALRWLTSDVELCLALVFVDSERSVSGRVLTGFFPLEIRNRYNHFPVKTARLWKHKHCHLCVPLMRRDHAPDTLSAFFDWIASDSSRCNLLELGHISGEGPFHKLLVQTIDACDRANRVDVRFTRPQLDRAVTAEAYLSANVSKKHQKDLEKKQKKLSQLGNVEYVTPNSAAEVEDWVNQFIALEASGWKGKLGEALALHDRDAHFFRESMCEAWRVRRLDLLGLRLGTNLIALKFNLPCPGGSFAYVITYDEAYSAYSPGLLLEIENIRRVHGSRSVVWMDSCADKNSTIFNRIWAEKRLIETLLVSNNSRVGDFWIAAIPVGHWLRRVLKPMPRRADVIKLSPAVASTDPLHEASPVQQTSSTPTESLVER